MKFYIINKDIEAQISELMKLIKLGMNGVVAERLENAGMCYSQNYGVSISRLREIAKRYSCNHDLAVRLWVMRVRETMILSTLLEQIDRCDQDFLIGRVGEVDNIEMAEQFVMNLLIKIELPESFIKRCLGKEGVWFSIVAFLLSARLYQKLSVDFQLYLTKLIVERSSIQDYNLGKSMALCLSKFVREGNHVKEYIVSVINGFDESEYKVRRLIASEVCAELLFFKSIDKDIV